MNDDERLDDLQFAGLKILQKTAGFRFGMDAVLLSDFVRAEAQATVADFGTGTGILPLLMWGRGKGQRFEAFEIQREMADMARRSVALNGLSARIRVHEASVEEAPSLLSSGSVDVIVCNPPYGMPGATLHNPGLSKDLARHQDQRGLKPWFTAAYRLLRGRGRMALIYPAPMMLSLMNDLSRAALIPKRFRMIYPRVDKPANLVLVEAVKDARPTLQPEPPLIVYEQDGTMTPELRKIYHQQD
ncbi:MAG TPA: methyltransferase [Candidatus Egerieenecus merdigallinarum]|nr:methyltransferase [Candidatus Egerieenecus merdigallinarum]